VTLAQGVRSGTLISKRDSAGFNAPEQRRAQRETSPAGLKRRAAVTEMPLRRATAYANDNVDSYDSDPEFTPQPRRQALRVSLSGGLVPRTLWGRIAAGAGLVFLTGLAIGGGLWVRSFLLHDEHFIVPNSASFQISGAGHLSRAQLLSIFGEDVDRSVFNISLEARRTELESLPWVAHATVMRLLPNRVRIAIVERTPVAFVRRGDQVALVDASGALFDLPSPEVDDASEGATGKQESAQYSFPVLAGIMAVDPISTRAARMKIYMEFMAALDAAGEGISRQVSEVNISNPEDLQAILPDSGSGSAPILVHFGQEKYLERYHQYRAHLAEWRAQYPRLASVDMRYEQQVVLEMQKDSTAVIATSAATPVATSPAAAVKTLPASKHPQGIKLKESASKSHRQQAVWHRSASSTPAQGVAQ
jgi:cell division protein FtsQ